MTWWRRHPWILPFALLLLLVAAGVAQLKVSTIEFVNDDIRKVLATGGVGLAVTAVAGLLVTAVFKSIEQVREIRKEQLRVVRNISDAYHKVKAGQRQLRALGFLEKLEVPLPENVAQAAHAVLNELNAQQLFFEELTEDPEVAQLFKCQPEVSIASYQGRCIPPEACCAPLGSGRFGSADEGGSGEPHGPSAFRQLRCTRRQRFQR